MNINFLFLVNSALMGAGLAMDAFSVSLSNGLTESRMKTGKMLLVSGVYGIFQCLMPLIGYLLVHTVAEHFTLLFGITPFIALILLSYIGGKMIAEGIRDIQAEKKRKESAGKTEHADAVESAVSSDEAKNAEPAESTDAAKDAETAESYDAAQTGSRVLTLKLLLIQGIATSIDALSVGFTIADVTFPMALLEAVIIGLVTWAISFVGIAIGKRFGTKLASKAVLVGGLILVGIGLEILIQHFV